MSDYREKYIFKTHIDLEDGDYIVLREPTSFEAKEFGEDGKQNIDMLQKLFPKCIVEHNFEENGQPLKKEQVSAILLDSGTTFTKIIKIWMESITPTEKKRES